MQVHPHGKNGKKIVVIYRVSCKCTLRGEVNFLRKFLLGGTGLEVGIGEFRSFSPCIEGNEEKSAPRKKSWLRLCLC